MNRLLSIRGLALIKLISCSRSTTRKDCPGTVAGRQSLFFLSLILATGLLLTTAETFAQKASVTRGTVKVEPTDSPEKIIEKAARLLPTYNQLDALRNEYIAFVHFGPNTFTRREWGTGIEDPEVFDLKALDTDQWCRTMQAAGMKMVILTVKHHDGFVLWQSRYTQHGIMSTGFKDGKGDVLKNLSESCKKYGLKLGVYLSPADLYQLESPEGLYGNLSKYTTRTIPRAIPGRPFKNKTTFEFEVDDYNEYILNQLFELLTEYGEIHEVWFDGAHPKRKGGQTYRYDAWRKLIRTLAPKAVIFGREDIRWCGNEAGGTRSTEWNVITYDEDPNKMTDFHDRTDVDLGSREKILQGRYLHYQPAETNTSIREGWFYSDDETQKVRSADDVFDIYERSVGGNSIFLLNIPPTREGQFGSRDVEVLEEVGKRIRDTYGINLLEKAKGPRKLVDNNPDTYILLDKPAAELILSTAKPIKLNRIVLQEAIGKHGERIEKHAVDAWINNSWHQVAEATNVGYKRILRFPEVLTQKVRIRILESRLTPAISTVSAHYYPPRPPRVAFTRNKEGFVSMSPQQSTFNWNPNGQNAVANLSTGYKIYYTLDGSEPTVNSTLYTQPVKAEFQVIKAVSYVNDQKGTVNSEEFGVSKAAWQLVGLSSEQAKRSGKNSFDGNPRTFWQSESGKVPHYIALDLGAEYRLKAMVYTPQTFNGEGMMSKGTIQYSKDGQTWSTLMQFELGNLTNDPSPRKVQFPAPVTTRFIRIQADATEANSTTLTVAEVDFL